ncbi:hypothetical protein D7024_03095 [Desulfofundulus salinus]|uniref:Uncharacterized protein n=2 Tax=Desulfofundulus salinus TaxID=2419843 RepID=A0A494WZG0_9FIRM|nr:hypothetical protein D7024_03095 [Desulfofundulus salinum]
MVISPSKTQGQENKKRPASGPRLLSTGLNQDAIALKKPYNDDYNRIAREIKMFLTRNTVYS